MAKQTIDLGTQGDPTTGTSIRDGGKIINENFDELYASMDTKERFISGLYFHTIGNTDKEAIEVGNKFRGWPTDDRYVVGKVIALPFDVNDPTKVSLAIDNEI